MQFFSDKYLIVLLLSFLFISETECQVYNNGNIKVNPNENVYIQGGYYNQNGGRMSLLGIIHLMGNWMNYDNSPTIISNSTNGLLRLVGNIQQQIGGTQNTKFNNVELNNSQGVILYKEAEIRQVFTFVQGKVFTQTNYLNISSINNNAIIGHDINKYVVGNLRRYVSGFSPYDLPIGTASFYELANIKFNSMSGIQFVNSYFVQGSELPPQTYPSPNGIYVYPDIMNPVANPLSMYMSRYSYIAEFLNYGYWVVSPDNFGTADFKMTLTERGHTNGGQLPGQHALIRRNNSGNLWSAQGIYPSNSQVGSLNNPITVYMNSMSDFSHFIIGKSRDEFGPLAIELVSFESTCENGKVRIAWTTENENNNAYFTVEKSLDLINWTEVTRVPGQIFSNGENSYVVYDKSPWNGISYYRLKQKDIDGKETIFEDNWLKYVDCKSYEQEWITIIVKSNSQLEINFYSNIISPYLASIYDPLGRLLFKCKGTADIGNNNLIINASMKSNSIILIDFQCDNKGYKQKLIIPAY